MKFLNAQKVIRRIIVLGIFLSLSTFTKAAHFYIPTGDVNALKTAINTANTNNAADTIHLFPYSTYKLTTIDHNFIFVDNALPRIKLDGNSNNSLTILGNGAKLVLDRSVLGDVRILFLEDCTVHIYDLAFINGRANYDNEKGGALYVSGGAQDRSVKLYNCLFRNNAASQGGAIYNSAGYVRIENCTFTENDGGFLGSAINNFAGNIWIENSVIVNNIMRSNTSSPGAVYCQPSLFSPLSSTQIILKRSIVAKNTLQFASSPNHGKEFDLVTNSAIYTLGNNFIGAYDNSTIWQPPPFISCLPCSNGDYVGTSANVVDPLLAPLERHYDYQDTYSILAGSYALTNGAGYSSNSNPAIASYGIFPSNGEEDDEITIYGKNLSTISKIEFEGAEVTSGFTKTDTSLVVTVPAGAESGKITIVNANLVSATSHQEFKIGEDPVTGTDPDEAQVEFTFYPNPVSTQLHVNSSGNVFSITDVLGKELMNSNSEKIDVSNFPRGIYLIRCLNSVRRFVIE